ncbi:MAG: histidine kinase dimerization/phospho-acceptor domain-containing protein [Gammaproteobacteria bacterium]
MSRLPQTAFGQISAVLALRWLAIDPGAIQIAEQVEQAVQQMRQAVQDREMTLAGVSHDLRTPLARLRIAAEWMSDETLRAAMIQDIADMDAIIGDFLSFLRAGQYEAPQETDLAVLLTDLAAAYRRKGYHLDLRLASDASLRVRLIALARLLSNLLDNAYKHGAQLILEKLAAGGFKAGLVLPNRDQ